MNKTFNDVSASSPIFRLNDETGRISKFYPTSIISEENNTWLKIDIGKYIIRVKKTDTERMYLGFPFKSTYIFYADEVEALKRSNHILRDKIKHLENGLKQWKNND